MENCPYEVLMMIFSELDFESLTSLSVVGNQTIKSAICSTIDIHYCKKFFGLYYSLYQESEYLENEYYAILCNDGWYCSFRQDELSPVVPLKILSRIASVKTYRNVYCKLDALKKIIDGTRELQIINQQRWETNFNIALDYLQDPNY